MKNYPSAIPSVISNIYVTLTVLFHRRYCKEPNLLQVREKKKQNQLCYQMKKLSLFMTERDLMQNNKCCLFTLESNNKRYISVQIAFEMTTFYTSSKKILEQILFSWSQIEVNPQKIFPMEAARRKIAILSIVVGLTYLLPFEIGEETINRETH